MKRLIGYILIIFCLIVTQLPATTTFAAIDVTMPTFESISVDKKDVKVGDTVTFTINASDNESGLRSYLYLYYKSPITSKSQTIYMYYNAASGKYEGTLTMTESMESGEWKLDWFRIYDNADNYRTVQGPIVGSSFILTGTTVDVTMPTFESISVDKKDVKVGDTVTFTINASDNESGLRSYLYLYYKSPITSKSQTIYMYYNATSGKYEGTLTMSESMESGEWKLDWFRIYDNADNYRTVQGPIVGSSFILTGTTVDVTMPTFESISVDKKDVKVGDTVTFTINASDNESGLRSYLYLYYKSPITSKSQTIYMYYNATSGKYEGTLTMSESMESGEWKLDWFRIYDNADNYRTIQGPIVGSSFTLKDFTTDTKNPTFNSISLDKKIVDTNEYVGISTNVSDDYSVKSVVVNYIKPISNQIESISLTPDAAKENFTTNYYVSGDTEYGEWKVSSVEVTDLNGNKTTVTENLSDGNFTVLKPVPSLGNRIVSSSETWSNMVIYGDVYIGPSAVLSISSNVTITGNVYVLGAMRSYGGLNIYGTLNARSVYWGSQYYVYNGDVVLGGSNYISSMSVSSYPLQSVPLEIYDSPLNVEDGKIDIQGATVPVVDVYLENQKLNLNSNGTFRLNDFYIGNAKEITFKFIDIFGYVTTKTYQVNSDVTSPIVEGVNDSAIYNTSRTITFNEGTATLNGNSITSGTVVGFDGTYTLVVTDTAGNKTTVNFTIDKTSPVISIVNTVSDQSTKVTGTSEANSTITVQNSTGVLGSAKADWNGKFTVTIPKQTAGEKLQVTAKDAAGNISTVIEVVIQWTPKVNVLTDKDTFVTGSAEIGAQVYIKVGSLIIGKGKTDSMGNYNITIPVQSAGTKVGVVAKDTVGNYSPYTYVTVKDRTAPLIPNVNAVSDKSTTVTGSAEPDSIVTVKGITSVIGTAKADGEGRYTVTIPMQKAGVKLLVTATDNAKNESAAREIIVLDKTGPLSLIVNKFMEDDTVVTGTTEVGSVVYVKVGSLVIGNSKTDSKGNFSVTVPLQSVGTKVGVVAKDSAGNYSSYTYIYVQDHKAPLAPNVNEVSDHSSTVTGTAEIGATITVKLSTTVIGSAKVDEEGNYIVNISLQKAGAKLLVTATDNAGNESEAKEVTVQDKTAPLAPVVNKITAQDTVITGKAEPDTLVYIKVGSVVIGKSKTDTTGNFSVMISLQPVGTKVGTVVRDAAGNYSPYTMVTVE